jgi:hypothetical protein
VVRISVEFAMFGPLSSLHFDVVVVVMP